MLKYYQDNKFYYCTTTLCSLPKLKISKEILNSKQSGVLIWPSQAHICERYF